MARARASTPSSQPREWRPARRGSRVASSASGKVAPDWQDAHVAAGGLLGEECAQGGLGPQGEVRTEEHEAEARGAETVGDLLAGIVAELDLEVVVPDRELLADEGGHQRLDEARLVLAGVADEQVVGVGRVRHRRSPRTWRGAARRRRGGSTGSGRRCSWPSDARRRWTCRRAPSCARRRGPRSRGG
jgi:hypothetical protein